MSMQTMQAAAFQEIEDQIALIPDSQPSSQNPFRGFLSRISLVKKKTVIKPNYSTPKSAPPVKNKQAVIKHKRATPDSSSSSIGTQSMPTNPVLCNKHISFDFQANNNTDHKD